MEDFKRSLLEELKEIEVKSLDLNDTKKIESLINELKDVVKAIELLKEPVMDKLSEIGMYAQLELYVPSPNFGDGSGKYLALEGSDLLEYLEGCGYQAGDWISSSETC